MFKAQNCVGCGNCEVVCPTGASNLNVPGKIDHTKCIACGKCILYDQFFLERLN